jgi:hypothetical protein
VSLRDIHDFELALVEPCLAMSARGLLINEERRQSMIAALDKDLEPLKAQLSELVLPLLYDGMPRESLFKEKWTCPCCRNGKSKREECWSCWGFAKKPGKKQLQEAGAVLCECVRCNGEGQRITWNYKPSSDHQNKIVLYDLLKLPKRFKDKRLTTDEDALKSLAAHDKSGVIKMLLEFANQVDPQTNGAWRRWKTSIFLQSGRYGNWTIQQR